MSPGTSELERSITQDLTPAQRAAVEHKEGPLLVVAGAGSGKTRVITRRVAHLVAGGVPAERILAITFTNKAAGEMRERIEQLLASHVPDRRGATVSTFHSFAARLLRGHGPRIGIERNFTILDEGDQRSAIREAMAEANADPKLFPPPRVAHAIGRAKDALRTPAELRDDASSVFAEVVARTFEAYDRLKASRNALDFDDLLVRSVELLSRDQETRLRLAERFQFLLIDEYQDTNHAQYELARRLAQEHRNICATGDPDQSIYGWRGADVENILRFTRDWEGARVVTLERNYRSTKIVCRAANALIQHNKRRVPKELVTENAEGEPIELIGAPDGTTEAKTIARRVEEAIAAGVPPGEIAVFYRANSLSRGFEQALFERGVPYVVIGALEFYGRKEVKDVLAYLRVLVNPRDDVNLIRVLGAPPRGIGKASLEKLKAWGKEHGHSLLESIERLDQVADLPRRARAALEAIPPLFERLRARLPEGAEAVARAVVEETHYVTYLKEYYPEEEERGENVEAFVLAAREFDRRFGLPGERSAPPPSRVERVEREPGEDDGEGHEGGLLPLFAATSPRKREKEARAVEEPAFVGEDDPFLATPPGIEGFLEQVALISAQEQLQKDDDASDKVSLMTVHTAKGLEFDLVFVTGLESGIFPNGRAMDESPNGLEEERRLAYVAITRAKKKLVLSYADWRARFGKSSEPREPSIFLFELPDEVFSDGRAPRVTRLEGVTADFDEDDSPVWLSRRGRGEDTDWDDAPEHGGPDEHPAEVQGEAGSFGIDPPAADDDDRPRAPVRKRLWSRPVSETGAAGRPRRPAPPTRAPAGDVAISVGDRVRHEIFGVGYVKAVSGDGPGRRVKVDFLSHGEKNLVLQYARLTKVPV